MKKTYMPILAVAALLSISYNLVKAQALPEFQPFTYTHIYTWNTAPYQSFQYNIPSGGQASPMRFRLMTPNGFNRFASDGRKYPIIIFLHGSGEAGVYDNAPNNGVNEQDNEKQLVHGGQTHMNAVLNNKFPGFLLYPQIRRPNPAQGIGPAWGYDNLKAVEYILRKLIADYKIDPDRIYIHGLSMGGEGTWKFISWRPDLFAAAHPMSAAGTPFWKNQSSPGGYWTGEARQRYKHLGLRYAQGALDTGPPPKDGNAQVDAIREIGGNIRYSYYPNLGHGTWNSEYAKADFFSWFLSHRKNNIHVYNGQTSFCPGENFSVTMGLTPGFANYQWVKNDTTAVPFRTGATANEITVTQAVSASSGVGRYYARFQRSNGVWTRWSAPVDINSNRGLSTVPVIATNNQSLNLPALDGKPDVVLFGSPGKGLYSWRRDVTALANTSANINVNAPGVYTLRTRDAAGTGREADGFTPTEFRPEPLGCLSLPSAGVTITTTNSLTVPAPPANLFTSPASSTSMVISWDDRSTNETGFELYRSTTAGNGYELVTIIAPNGSPNPLTYTDTELLANKTYFYKMRSVNTTGGSPYTPETMATTMVDNEAPTAPVLSVGPTSRTEINLSWTGSTDNVGVTEYEIYQNNALINTTAATSYKVTGVTEFTTYNYVVKARDLSNNVSAPSNQVTPAAINSGLSYKYYHHTNIANVGEISSKATLVSSGFVNNFSIAPRLRDDGFAFIYDGYIKIPTTGSYTFWTESGEGSQLYVNNVLVVTHDNTHGCSERSGGAVSLSAGVYPVRALYFENTGGQCLTLRWSGPGFSKQAIPDAALKDTFTPAAPLTAPSNFAASASSFNQINLTWTDNSNNETGFEISRATSAAGTYQVVNVTTAGATSWADNTLNPATSYFYKVRTLNASSASPLVGPANATTQNAPGAPDAPTGLAASPASPTQVNLTWADQSSNESGFEIQKSSQPATGFVTFATTAANVNSYNDTQANSHTTIYYRVRSIRDGGATSGFSNIVSANTGNRNPTIGNITDRNIRTGTTQSLNVTATDPDTDPITFSFPNGLPAFASFQNDGFGKGILVFTNAVAGTYNIRVQASDGAASVFDDFVLVVNNNNSPVLTDIPFQSIEEGRTLIYTAAATDADGDPLTYTVANLPAFATWSASQRRITFRPLAGHAGIYENITINVRDNKTPAGNDSKSFTLVVSPIDEFFTISFNFSTLATLNEGDPWNNTDLPSTTDKTNFKDDGNNIVRYVALNTGTSWTVTAPQFVDLPNVPSAKYTEKVRESFYRKSSGGSGSKMKLKGLNPAMQYKLEIFGAGGWYTGTPPANLTVLNTRYIVAGLTSQQFELNTLNNVSNTVTTNFIKPTASGEINITVQRGTNNLNHYYINAMVLSGFYDDGSAPDAPSNVILNSPAHDTVRVAWQDNSFNETRFDIMRSPTLNGTYAVIGTAPANAVSFADASTTGRTTYYYKVRAANAAGTADSNPQPVTTANGKPVITPLQTIVVQGGQVLQRNFSATDPEGDPIVFTTLDLPGFATLVDNGNGTGYIRFEPQASDVGTFAFKLQATDNFSAQTELSLNALVSDPQYDEVVFLNFKGTGAASNAESPWNNIAAFNNATGLTNILGQPSSIQVRPRTGWTSSSNTAGVSAGTNDGLYPDNVVKSHWATSSISPGAIVTLKGLNSGRRYNITLFGSLNQFWFANTIYLINGTQKTLNTSKNKNNSVTFAGIQPAGDSIVITVRRGPNMNANPLVAQRDGILGAMIIEAATPGATPVRPTDLSAEGISKTAIRLTWRDNASDETGFEIYSATSQSGPFTLVQTTAANTETFTHTGRTPNTPYIYRVRAVKGGGSSAYTPDVYATTFSQIILINVNSSTASGHLQAPAPWNNLATPPAEGVSFSNFKDDTNAATTVDMEIFTWANGGTNNTGFKTGNNSGIYPDAVLENYYYYEQFDPATTYNLSSLNNSASYDLHFLGNEWTIATVGNMIAATDYAVGNTTVSQFNGKNSTETVAIKNVQPEAGVISFEIKANDEARYGIWTALELRSYTPIPSVFDINAPSAPQKLVASQIGNTSVRLSWSDASDDYGIGGYEVYEGSNLVATTTDTTAVIGGLTPATAYIFNVKATDATLNRSSASKGLRVMTTSTPGAALSRTATTEAAAVSEEETRLDAALYPNPVKDYLTIVLPSTVPHDEPVAIHIYSIQGLQIGQLDTRNREEGIEINTANYHNGLYIVNIDIKGRRILKRFVKE